MLLCTHCNKECKNANSNRNHERLCKENPLRQHSYFENNQDKLKVRREEIGYTNQYIKAKTLGLPMPQISDEARAKMRIASAARTDEWHKENGKRIAKTVNEKVEEGTWHTSLAKHMHYNYNGIDLHGTWELEYAKYLDAKNIAWIRNKDSFSYNYEGKARRYTPDFYLVDTDEYIEIKGYKTDKDSAKWEQFPAHRTLVVLMKKELIAMGIAIKV